MLRKSSVYWAWLAKRGDLATGWLHRAQNRRPQPSQIPRPSRAPQTIEGCRVPGRGKTPAARTMRLKVLKPYGYKTMTPLFLITTFAAPKFLPENFLMKFTRAFVKQLSGFVLAVRMSEV